MDPNIRGKLMAVQLVLYGKNGKITQDGIGLQRGVDLKSLNGAMLPEAASQETMVARLSLEGSRCRMKSQKPTTV
jgi:hypothetical protein